LTGLRSHQEEVRNIGARDQEDHADGTENDQQRLAHVANDDFLEGVDAGRELRLLDQGGRVVAGPFFEQPGQHGGGVIDHTVNRHASAHPGDSRVGE